MDMTNEAKFTEKFIAALAPQLAAFPGAVDDVRNRVMIVQNVLPNGRVNVKFTHAGVMQYRTFARRDLVIE